MNNLSQNIPHIRLLGAFEIEYNGLPAGEPRRTLPLKAQALLAYLTAQPGQWHGREQLADLLWPTLIPAAGRNNLRQVLLILHRALTDQEGDNNLCLQANRCSVRYDPCNLHQIDLIDFMANQCKLFSIENTGTIDSQYIELLSQRIALYRGELLAGLTLEYCDEYTNWLRVQRESLRRQAMRLIECLIQILSQQGRYDEALYFAQRLIDLDPLSEEGYRTSMRLLSLKGQPAAALAQYEACRRIFVDEMGTLPDIHTRQLADDITELHYTSTSQANLVPLLLEVKRSFNN